MKILIATQNKHKVGELQYILKDHILVTPGEMGIPFDFEETGSSFFENSYGKAMELYKSAGLPVIADDSGLVVPALGGEPGIYSARYGASEKGKNLEAPERNEYLLNKMNGITNREAFFVCCMTLILTENRFFSAQETMEGIIASEPSGVHGFGYDPLFYLPEYGKTVAQIPEEEKNRISHRGRAGRRINVLLKELESEK